MVLGTGLYLPKRVVSNDELASTLVKDTNDEWIRTRTGIKQRHIAADGEFTSHMAFEAAKAAIADSGIDKGIIDLIIVCTTTPDNTFPSVATKLQGYLGLGNIPAFDLQAVCAGFVYGIHVADSMMHSGRYKTVLLVGAERMTSILDWNDRGTSVLFGDGAGAVILQKTKDSGVIDSLIYSEGTLVDILYTDGGPSSSQTSGVIKMQGQEVFKQAINRMSDAAEKLLAKAGMDISDVDYFVPHQANIRIIDGLITRLGLDDSKVVKTVDRHANCSAASVPLALAELKKSGKLQKGDVIMMTAIGAGITWGAALLRW
jgi:3-oxoacyl-[acyl-carrier-protein] synthase-3